MVTELGNGSVIETCTRRLEAIQVPHAQPYLTCLALRLDTDSGSVVYSDTGPSEALEKLARGCDILIHMCSYKTGTVDNEATQRGTSGHMEAARTAAAARARRLVATHIYDQFDRPRYAGANRCRDGKRVPWCDRSRRGPAGALGATGNARIFSYSRGGSSRG